MKVEKKPVGKFECYRKNGTSNEILQGIVYSDGTCKVGLDVFRDLNPKLDCSSHESKWYSTIDAVKELYFVRKPNKHMCYYIKEEKRCLN